jgi:hypothetical protein
MNTTMLILTDALTSLMNKIFDACVNLLEWLAALTGTTYEEINVIIFVVLEPIVFILLFGYVVFLRKQLTKLMIR